MRFFLRSVLSLEVKKYVDEVFYFLQLFPYRSVCRISVPTKPR